MTVEAQAAGRFTQIRGKSRAMHVVAGEARYAVGIHLAGDKIISLHPVLVRGAVGEVSESGVAQLVFLQSPVIAELPGHVVTHRPVVVFSLNRIRQRAAL